ncbi:MAG: hypothetical protein JSV96_01550 [Candidatus Aminicenantes bacterium]|nr:MAG: hypothetical protein JSV96_01550 [Candidatus Aminicenantes bacterium]
MRNPFLPIVNLVVIAAFIFAFVAAETKHRIILVIIMALLFILPSFFQSSTLGWIFYAGRVIFGLGCYIYIKGRGFLK